MTSCSPTVMAIRGVPGARVAWRSDEAIAIHEAGRRSGNTAVGEWQEAR